MCKRDMKALQMDPDHWETLAADRPRWRSSLKTQLKTGVENLTKAAMEKRARRKAPPPPAIPTVTLPTSATSVAESADHALACTAICGAADYRLSKKSPLPWSALTDGGLLLSIFVFKSYNDPYLMF